MSLSRRTLLPCLLAALYLLPAGLAAEAASDGTPIRGGESRSMTLDLAAGQFLGLAVEQDRTDLVVELSDPQGRTLATVDSPDFWLWEEEIAFIAEASGPHRLEVHPFLEWAAPGSYRVRIDGPRAPRDTDRKRIEALREMAAAHALIGLRARQAERLEHLERALRTWRSLGDRRREAETLHQAMEVLSGLGRAGEAAERFRQAAELWQELGLPVQRAWTLLESSRRDKGFFEGEEARRNMEAALELARQGKSRFVEARALYALGRFHEREPRRAVACLEAAERIARETGALDLRMSALYQLGFTYDDLAEKQDALRCYEEALKLSRELGEPATEFNALNSLGHLYLFLGDPDKAVQHLRQALDLSRGQDARKEAAALNNLALAYEKLEPSKAREMYLGALALGRDHGMPDIQAMAMSNLAALDLGTGDPSAALERGRGALLLAAGDKAAESHARQVVGMALRELGDLAGSRRELQASLDLSRGREDRVRQSQVIPQLARTERRAGDPARALALLEEGVGLVESLRTELVQEELRATFLASRRGTYELYIDTLMTLHRAAPGAGYDAEALRASERASARSLLDILAEAGADVREGADPALLEKERRLLATIEELEKDRLERLDQSAEELGETTARLAAALEELGRVEGSLRVSSPRYAALTQPRPASLAEIQREALDGRALLLEYSLGEERSYLWAVTPDALHSFELPPRARIEEAARRWYGALVVHPREAGYPRAAEEARKAADELSDMLLRPVEGMLSGQPLLVVGDGALQYLPFGALPVPASPAAAGRGPLIARQEVVSLPSASALVVLRHELADRPAAPKTLAVLADPVFQLDEPRARRAALQARRGAPAGPRAGEIDPRRLPRLRFSQEEAEAIAALVPDPRQRFKALGFAASRAAATGGELALYRMVHFATHGLIDSRRPELSSLVLSLVDERGEPQNGFLRLHDVYNLELRADLVVLSACQTALGQEIRGEGLVGLTRGFMYAGAARVLASLWSVDDRATAELMKRFYVHVIAGGMSAAAALRQAQIDLASTGQWQAPYYWAGFTLQGEWR